MKTRGDLLVRVAGLVACFVVGLPVVTDLAHRPELLFQPVTGFSLAAILLFGLLFWIVTSERDFAPGWQIAMVAVQTLLAVALTLSVQNGLTSILLVVTAALAAELLSVRAAVTWLVLQTVAVGCLLVYGTNLEPQYALINCLAFAGFQVFALHHSLTTARERRGREELTRVNAELLATRKLLEDSSRAAERLRISRELHDGMGHHLAALSLSLEAARHAPEAEKGKHVGTAQGLTKRMLQEVREVVGQLREGNPIDLAGALAELAAGIERPAVHLAFPGDLRIDDPEHAHALLRCAQEILTNAVRHAAARNLWLEVVQGPDGLELRARDDGRGAGAVRPGNGLTGMRERLEQLGGRLAVETVPGSGFRVRAWLP
ncbi:MAG TPA: sensor histidine kinase [Thermoanaerobaculia bacterium]|nr:sensor histidine kinase [Thermoanaerobaculia bacterium]